MGTTLSAEVPSFGNSVHETWLCRLRVLLAAEPHGAICGAFCMVANCTYNGGALAYD